MEKKAEGFVWTEQAIASYLEKPKDYISRTRMSLDGRNKEEDRVNVITYLMTFN